MHLLLKNKYRNVTLTSPAEVFGDKEYGWKWYIQLYYIMVVDQHAKADRK